MSNPSLFSEIIHTNLEILPQSQSAFTCSKLTIETQEQAVKYVTLKTPERRHWHRSGAFSVNFEHISHLVLVFLLLTFNMKLPPGYGIMHDDCSSYVVPWENFSEGVHKVPCTRH